MAIDGVFIHYLLEEIKPQIINKRIQKLICINDYEYQFVLPYKQKLLITLNAHGAHIRLTEEQYLHSPTILSAFLKKHLEGGLITDLYQYHNDRIIIMNITNTDDLGYHLYYNIILELTGRNSNLIITDNNYTILECLKKSIQEDRILQPKATYEFLESNKVNPYTIIDYQFQELEGVSKLLLEEINYVSNLKKVINQEKNPTIIESNDKVYFYVFDLKHLEGKRTHFASISEMLEEYFTNKLNEISQNNEQKRLYQFINKEISKLSQKLAKQEIELQEAKENLKLQEVANVLVANIHLVKPRQEEITVFNFYTNENITIKLRTDISPTENINYYFNKYKKAKRTITQLQETIQNTKADISYYETLKNQAELSNNNDLKEILMEVGIKKAPPRKPKIQLLSFIDRNNNTIWVGKNNIQNEYLTFSVANKNDYFFHVVGYPGSHVIFRGDLNDEAIKLAATIAATYSKAKATVTVHYTQVKWVKKVKGQKGSFVTYTHEKSTFAQPDLDYIKQNTNLHI